MEEYDTLYEYYLEHLANGRQPVVVFVDDACFCISLTPKSRLSLARMIDNDDGVRELFAVEYLVKVGDAIREHKALVEAGEEEEGP